MSAPYAEVIGDPVDHSKSPLIHKFWLEKLGIEGDYRAVRVKSDGLADYFARRRQDPDWRGCNVTVPLKEAVLAHLVNLSAEARAIGAVNCVTPCADGLLGTNTDAKGVSAALAAVMNEPHELGGRRALLIGAGGAARAAMQALSAEHIGFVTIMNRSAERARALLGDFAVAGEVAALGPTVPGVDVLINASMLGMHGQPELDIDLAALPGCAIVFDVVYAPLETRLLASARRRGLRVADGLSMLVAQAREAFGEFFGQLPPSGHDRTLRALLVR